MAPGTRSVVSVVVLSTAVLAGARVVAQAPPTSPGPQVASDRQGGRATGGGGARGGSPIPFDNYAGFRSIFDGQTLAGWDGDPAFWRAEGGAIVGESTAATPVTENTFLIWRGGEPADFELKLEFRMNATNSGVQYRSVHLPPGTGGVSGRWVLKGYQADIDFANQYTGMLYEERGRAFLAPRGTFGYVGANQPAPSGRGQAPPAAVPGAPPAGPRGQVAALEDGEALKAHIRQNDWNQFQVIARGHVLIHVINGRVMALFVDDDAAARATKGLVGLQLHVGAPMKVEFRNVYLKEIR